jgi:hypothetical protein
MGCAPAAHLALHPTQLHLAPLLMGVALPRLSHRTALHSTPYNTTLTGSNRLQIDPIRPTDRESHAWRTAAKAALQTIPTDPSPNFMYQHTNTPRTAPCDEPVRRREPRRRPGRAPAPSSRPACMTVHVRCVRHASMDAGSGMNNLSSYSTQYGTAQLEYVR